MVLELCRFLNKYITKHGRNNPFKWVTLQPEFEKMINRKFPSDKALKNKYDGMRKEYNLWKSLKHGETGLGWNESTGQLDCDDEWWAKKIQENQKYEGIQNNQPSKQLQEEWDLLYGDAVASGENCVAPSMDPTTFTGVHVEILDDENVEGGDNEDAYQVYNETLERLEKQEAGFYGTFMKKVIQDDASAPSPSGVAQNVEKPTKINTKPKPVNMKRKGRDSLEASMLKDHLTQSNLNQQRVLDMLESSSSKPSQSNEVSVDVAVGVLNRMVDAGLLNEYEELWFFAMDLLEDPVKRKMFMSVRHDEGRVAWLKNLNFKESPRIICKKLLIVRIHLYEVILRGHSEF
uniref:uncharacterized protein LOC122609555 n=1 Tax=Erigeron canadensis TaxID=72917 RepID=UPI001CB8F637|nr:uncharacterized protein LOC122609555 [Erigeron canadensis]